MSRIVISGYYGFGNAGDEAMLAAILEAIFKVMPHAKVTVISGNPAETIKKHAVKAVPRLSAWQVWQAIAHCDMVISGGGSLLQDVTSKRSLYYYLAVIYLAKVLQKPVMLYAQGIGPLQRKSAQNAVGRILNYVDLITVRDQRSLEALQKLGVTKPPIHVTADAVLSMHPVDITIGKRLLQSYPLKGTAPLVGVSVRAWKQDTQYRQELASTLDRLVREKQCHVVFIPMQFPDDAKEAEQVAAMMEEESIVLSASYTTTELLSLTGVMDVLIGVRLHALVFASLMEKPVVGISYDPKIDNFLHMIGKNPIGELCNLNRNRLYDEVCQALECPHQHEASMACIRRLREESLQNAYMAFELLEKTQAK